MKNKIQKAIFSLLGTEPYYAHFIMECKVSYDAYGCQTAGVGVHEGIPQMVFNSVFLSKLSPEQTVAVLKHEVLHLVLDHLTHVKEMNRDPIVSNIAQDCAINQYIEGLPEGCVTLPAVNKVVGKTLKPRETSAYYYDELMKKKKQLEASGMKNHDDHALEGMPQDSGELAKGAVARVAESALKQAAGKAPEVIVQAVASLGQAKLPWRVLLRNAIMTQVSRQTQATAKKVNRRFPLPVPGKRHKRTMTLGVCVDESGSVNDEQHAAFMTEIQSIAKTITKTYLIHADCVVAEVEDLSKKKFKATRRAAGGTAYQPAIDKARELGCTMIVYFGDFDTSDKPKNPGVPFLWVGVGNQPAPGDFGKVIRL